MILITVHHLRQTERKILITTNSVLSQTGTRTAVHSPEKAFSRSNHNLLKYDDDNSLLGAKKDSIGRNTEDQVYEKRLVDASKQQTPLNGKDSLLLRETLISNGVVDALRPHSRLSGKFVTSTGDNEEISGAVDSIALSSDPALMHSNSAAEVKVESKSAQSLVHSQSAVSDHYTGKPSSVMYDHCDVSGIKSWHRGVVTELEPRIRANCDLLRHNDRPEIERVKREIKTWQNSETEEEWIERLSDCEKVVSDFSNNFYNSPEEVDFPLAYILIVYTNPRQMVRLIKTLWKPQNVFCIHPDAKQSEEFIGVFRQLSKCLDNVFLPTKLEKVFYQHHTIMDSQLNCYKDLLNYQTWRWKYVINLCGRELPLKTNREIVRSLKTLKGGSAIETQPVQMSRGFLARDRFTWKAEENYTSGKLHYTHSRLGPPPIPIYKSFNFVAVSRPFVDFFVNDRKAIQFRNYLKDVKIPEEEFYASLVHLPKVPGGLPPHRAPLPTVDKYIWMNKHTQTRSRLESCEGRMVHFICIVGVGDLDQIYRWGVLRKTPVFFFNKYFMEEDHVVMDCLEERLLQQNKREYEMDCIHKH